MQSKGGASKTSFACKGAREKRRYAHAKAAGRVSAAAKSPPQVKRVPSQAYHRWYKDMKIGWDGKGPFCSRVSSPKTATADIRYMKRGGDEKGPSKSPGTLENTRSWPV